VLEALVEVFLLNVLGSAAVASAVVACAMTSRLSRELAGLSGSADEPLRHKHRDPLDRS